MSDSVPLWQTLIEWAWAAAMAIAGLIATLVGVVFSGLKKDIKANADEIQRVDGEMDKMKESIDDKIAASDQRRREDTIGIHQKIDAGFDRLADKIDGIRNQ